MPKPPDHRCARVAARTDQRSGAQLRLEDGHRTVRAPRVLGCHGGCARADGETTVQVVSAPEGSSIVVSTSERVGVLSLVAGVLSSIACKFAELASIRDGPRAAQEWFIRPLFGNLPMNGRSPRTSERPWLGISMWLTVWRNDPRPWPDRACEEPRKEPRKSTWFARGRATGAHRQPRCAPHRCRSPRPR